MTFLLTLESLLLLFAVESNLASRIEKCSWFLKCWYCNNHILAKNNTVLNVSNLGYSAQDEKKSDGWQYNYWHPFFHCYVILLIKSGLVFWNSKLDRLFIFWITYLSLSPSIFVESFLGCECWGLRSSNTVLISLLWGCQSTKYH